VQRLTDFWQAAHQAWSRWDLTGADFVYWWVGGIHFNVRLKEDRLCCLVVVRVRADGSKEMVALADDYRESAESWAVLLNARRHQAEVLSEIWDIHLDDTYGSPRMTTALRSRGYVVNHKRVERLMADNGIYAPDGRRRKLRTTIPDLSGPLPDLVVRDFAVGEPTLRSCGDITYIPTNEGWLYRASVVDLGSRRLVGFSLGDNTRTGLVSSALQAAARTRGRCLHGLILRTWRLLTPSARRAHTPIPGFFFGLELIRVGQTWVKVRRNPLHVQDLGRSVKRSVSPDNARLRVLQESFKPCAAKRHSRRA